MENRRSEDKRMDKLEEDITTINKTVGEIKTKIYNGFSSSIASTENKVNYIDARNEKEHAEIRSDIKDLSKNVDKINTTLNNKMDRLLWKLVGMTFFVMLSSIFANLMGWL